MNIIIRFLWTALKAKWLPQVNSWDTTRTSFRVRLRDLDLLRHMTNSAYFRVLDLARIDLVVRSGYWAHQRRLNIVGVVANQTITYRKSLKWRDKFQVETRIVGIDEKAAYFEHRFTVRGEIYAQALARVRFIKIGVGTVPMSEVMIEGDGLPADRLLQPWIRDWAANTALPPAKQAVRESPSNERRTAD